VAIGALGDQTMSETPTADPASIRPGLANGSLIFVVVVAAIVALSLLAGGVFGLKSLFAAFLFAWYWANVEATRFDRLPAALIGALVGIGLAWLLQILPAQLGPSGGLVALLAILVAVFVQIQNWLPLVCNTSSMLFLTVMAAPVLVEKTDFLDVAICIVLGAGFFAAIVRAAQWVAARRGAAG
jgi:hypothetical protein